MGRPRRPVFYPRLAEYRERLGLTQEEVASKLASLARTLDGTELPATGNLVARHERARHFPTAIYRRQYTRLYSATEEQLGLRLVPRSVAAVEVVDNVGVTSGEEATDDPVRRRDLIRLASTAVLATAAVGATSFPEQPLAELARALTAYRFITPISDMSDEQPTAGRLRAAVADVKRCYQACRYRAAVNLLPAVLEAARRTCVVTSGDELLNAYALTADAYQVAASIMLKYEYAGLAIIAADRSMDAAGKSQNPVVVASSARAVTHSLMSGGHPGRALEISVTAAERLDQQVPHPPPDALSVYGALILRGAIAAARNEDRAAATRLLDEAEATARRLGRDDNARWTAFGPTNVLLHRVNVATQLGDAGTAVETARRVDVDRIAIAERKAALFIDTAQALTQWGRYEQAFDAVCAAEQVAAEEVRSRRAVHTLLSDLAARSPRTLAARVREFASAAGATS